MRDPLRQGRSSIALLRKHPVGLRHEALNIFVHSLPIAPPPRDDPLAARIVVSQLPVDGGASLTLLDLTGGFELHHFLAEDDHVRDMIPSAPIVLLGPDLEIIKEVLSGSFLPDRPRRISRGEPPLDSGLAPRHQQGAMRGRKRF